MNTMDLRSALKAHDSSVRALERRVRTLTTQRDAAVGKSEQPAPAPVVPDASMRIEVTLDDSPVPIPIEVRGTTQMLMRLEAYLNGRVREIEELRAAAPAVPLTEPHPVGNLLLGDDWEDVVTVTQMHNYSAAMTAKLRDALETARNGLLWYRDAYPEAESGCDDEAMQEINAALGIGTQGGGK